jgi:TATA-box binding protein (TBP) (component of TFIID and TFIIIB)
MCDYRAHYEAILEDMQMMRHIETFVANAKREDETKGDRELAGMIAKRAKMSAEECQVRRRTQLVQTEALEHVSDEMLKSASRFANGYALKPYAGYLEHVPRTVNVVSRVVAEPIEGSGTTLPLDLNHIVSHCSGAYFWPIRFCPVQIAFHDVPRTRVLIFHTGKIVGTGSRGPTSARLAIMMTIEKLAKEANIFLRVHNFQIKNLVGTVHLGATINLSGLAKEYSIQTGYDRCSFVGLSWRPWRDSDDGICCEVYSTGKMNLPGACTHTQLLAQFSQMHPTLLRFSSFGNKNAPLVDDLHEYDEEYDVDDDNDVHENEQTSTFDGRAKRLRDCEVEVDDETLWEGWS